VTARPDPVREGGRPVAPPNASRRAGSFVLADSPAARDEVAAAFAGRLEALATGQGTTSWDVADLYVQAKGVRGHVDGQQSSGVRVEIQSRIRNVDAVGCELVSLFDEGQCQQLEELGFEPPDGDELPNWWAVATTSSERSSCARAVVDALVDVCGLPLEVVHADVVRSSPEPAFFAIVDDLDLQQVQELLVLAPTGPGASGVGWFRRAAPGWVADPTIPRRLRTERGQRLRSISPEMAASLEPMLRF
jgi:hypothetical protein